MLYAKIVLSCMAIVAMSNRCDDTVKWRKTCSGNYSSKYFYYDHDAYLYIQAQSIYKCLIYSYSHTRFVVSCASNCSICTSPYGNCVRYEVLKDSRGRVYDKRSGSFCTQSLSWSNSSCNLVAATYKC